MDFHFPLTIFPNFSNAKMCSHGFAANWSIAMSWNRNGFKMCAKQTNRFSYNILVSTGICVIFVTGKSEQWTWLWTHRHCCGHCWPKATPKSPKMITPHTIKHFMIEPFLNSTRINFKVRPTLRDDKYWIAYELCLTIYMPERVTLIVLTASPNYRSFHYNCERAQSCDKAAELNRQKYEQS